MRRELRHGCRLIQLLQAARSVSLRIQDGKTTDRAQGGEQRPSLTSSVIDFSANKAHRAGFSSLLTFMRSFSSVVLPDVVALTILRRPSPSSLSGLLCFSISPFWAHQSQPEMFSEA